MNGWVAVVGSMLGTMISAAVISGWSWRHLRRWMRMVDDLLGEPARPGQPARPGVMERLAYHDRLIGGLASQIQIMQGQIRTYHDVTATALDGGTHDR